MKKILFGVLFLSLIFPFIGCEVNINLPNHPGAPGTPVPETVKVTVTTIAGGGLDGKTWGSADGTGTSALFDCPNGIAIGSDGSIYVSDMGNNKIRKINPATREVTTIAGGGSNGQTSGHIDGTDTSALFKRPVGIAVAADGSIYVTDFDNCKIRRITFN